jgi:hypothetical protein
MKPASFRFSICLLPLAAVLLAACEQEEAPLPDDLLGGDQQMVVVPRGSDDGRAYLAIRKDTLSGPSLRLAKDKLLVLDVAAPRPGAPVTAPPKLLEAYPLVDLPELTRLRGADRYVVIDPSAGAPNPDPIDPLF